MESDNHTVYTLNVSDRFGDSGLTGIVIIHYDGKSAFVDSFLMSCRVIGRGVELSFWYKVIQDIKNRGCKLFFTEYIKTAKNDQVSSFYETIGFEKISATDTQKNYSLKFRKRRVKK